jgi:cysteinyl-tRNA synthetase
MTLQFFNTLGRKIEIFKPLHDKEVRFYSCGPTVYWYQHIGNLRSYIFADVLKRVLSYEGFAVNHVMNYTDVGHLTSDADTGEDKMEVAVKRESKTAQEIAEHYASAFEKDARKLNIIPPSVTCKATDHIKEQIEMVKALEKKGFTYETEDGIYFDTSRLKDYGKLANLKIEGLEAGRRVEVGGKRNKTDFALWKFSDQPGKRQQEWDSPWGVGFPGWHIECSAMSSKYLGEQFDIHSGGEDHIPVHHTNEIAQSEAAFGIKPWVRFWLHGAFLTFRGEKVSKSKGGLYTVSELEELGYEPLAYRYLCLLTHYRKPLEFSLESLDAAKNAFERLKNKIIELRKENTANDSKIVARYKERFLKAIDDDLNIPKAMGIMWEMFKEEKLGSKEKLGLLFDFDKVFGLSLEKVKEEKVSVSKEIEALIQQREEARKNKDFKTSDKIRDELKAKGIELIDSKDGVKWKKV